ncbi:MAG: glutathione peroxidase [Planctomycetota bacterium]|nr:glutathione peroxidase [Planctomycetota bacterium]MDA1213630.1 glutathione peroxidase [Planctomycetota bacterium]
MNRNIVSCAVLGGMLLFSSVVMSGDKDVPQLLQHKMKTLKGKTVDLSQYKGKVLLIVNTASQCGATPQYEPLQALHEKYNEKGLVVLGFPCNQFGKQEPGTESEIATFCKENYGVTFDMFAKIDVNGDKQADLFKDLTSEEFFSEDSGPVKWNFEKFLVAKDGTVVARFRTKVDPGSEEVVNAIEAELTK